MTAPKTLREKYTLERDALYARYDAMNSALNELVAGEATASYTIGNRSTSVTRANLKDLQDALKIIQDRIDELEAILSGRPVRSILTHSFSQPTNVFWRW